jgi:hypothetical protein
LHRRLTVAGAELAGTWRAPARSLDCLASGRWLADDPMVGLSESSSTSSARLRS